MRVLKVTYEVPLGPKTAAQDLKKAAELVAGFSKTLAEAGFDPVDRTEIIVTRKGNGS